MTQAAGRAKPTLIVLAVLSALLGLGYYAFVRPLFVVDRLGRLARPEQALPGPTVAPEHAGVELALRDEYRTALLSEDMGVATSDRLAVINRWTREIYPLFNAYMLACLLDPPTWRIAGELGADTPAATAANIRAWVAANLVHTQDEQGPFRGMPGNDPWGALNLVEPSYHKVLPSEMLALSLYTGEMTGKCDAMATLITGLFTLQGAAPDDVMVFRLEGHNIGMVRYGGETYVSSNQRIWSLNDDPKLHFWVDGPRYPGFFGYSLALMEAAPIEKDVLTTTESLMSYVAQAAGVADRLPGEGAVPADALQSREALLATVFGKTDIPQHARTYTLARYAYQSLYVRNPELYLQASLRAPNVRELARRLREPEQMIAWIRANVRYAPLFEDHAERLMLADQVIVFQRGTYKDQAVLFYSLLKLNGFEPVIRVTRDDAYIEVGSRIYRAGTWRTVDRIAGEVQLTLTLDP